MLLVNSALMTFVALMAIIRLRLLLTSLRVLLIFRLIVFVDVSPCVIVLVVSNFLIRDKKWQQDIAKSLSNKQFKKINSGDK